MMMPVVAMPEHLHVTVPVYNVVVRMLAKRVQDRIPDGKTALEEWRKAVKMGDIEMTLLSAGGPLMASDGIQTQPTVGQSLFEAQKAMIDQQTMLAKELIKERKSRLPLILGALGGSFLLVIAVIAALFVFGVLGGGGARKLRLKPGEPIIINQAGEAHFRKLSEAIENAPSGRIIQIRAGT